MQSLQSVQSLQISMSTRKNGHQNMFRCRFILKRHFCTELAEIAELAELDEPAEPSELDEHQEKNYMINMLRCVWLQTSIMTIIIEIQTQHNYPPVQKTIE